MAGKVYLVGAGPGDPELLTLRAARLLAEARVVAYDELVPEAILALAPAAERIPVGRRAFGVRYHEAAVHPAVLERAAAGETIVRLKGGDPMIFGRGGEEAAALAARGVTVEVVPGVTAALGAAAARMVPLTHRRTARFVTLATAHTAAGGTESARELAADLPVAGTLVLYMGTTGIAETAAALIARGRDPTVPVMIVSRATLPDESALVSTLGAVGAAAAARPPALPALVIVGDVVALGTGGDAPGDSA